MGKEKELAKVCKQTDDNYYETCKIRMQVNFSFMQTLYNLGNQLISRSERDPGSILSFTVRYKDIENYKNIFQDACNVVLAKCSDETRSVHDQCLNDFYEMYYSTQVLKETILPTSSQTQSMNQPSRTQQVCLPKIAIPHYSGVYVEWPNFIAMFDSLIHNNTELSSVQKMHYLVSVLEKEPLSLIRHLELSELNYAIAYNILRERYENKRLIADKHLEAILSLQSISLNSNQLNSNLRKFVNCLKENILALSALGFNTSSWSFLLLHIMLRKLPMDLRSRFELEYGKSSAAIHDIPTFDNLLNFMETHLRVLESISGFKGTTLQGSSGAHTNQGKALLVKTRLFCVCCQGDHNIYSCDKFNSMTPHQRKDLVFKQKLCFNCLRSHPVSKCQSQSRCQACNGHHHSKLHIENNSNCVDNSDTSQPSSSAVVSTHGYTALPSSNPTTHGKQYTMLLGTALVGVRDVNGYIHTVRALLDSGSQVTIMTEYLAQKLRLPRSRSGALFGLGESNVRQLCGSIECSIHSLLDNSKPSLVTTAVVLKRITGALPSCQVSPEVMEKCRDITLADHSFALPGSIDLLIGVDLYNEVFDGRRMQLGAALPTAHSSIFGWILLGKAPINSLMCSRYNTLSCTVDLDSILARFWEVEEAPARVIQDPEDLQCEKHFAETHTRDSHGRFIVRLPFKTAFKPLGSTYEYSLKRFHSLERKLLKDSKLREMYVAFMDDYLESGHMRPISNSTSSDRYYIPHHGVLKESSSTTKLRAVFDASASSSSGVSLNQVLMPGPKLQQNIEDIILRFRTHAVVFTCDIKQMYRQVRLCDGDCKYQTILWRAAPDQPIQKFELTTVTYGVSSAAYLAMRVIHELASLNEVTFPEAARVLKEDTFVDDVISGGNNVDSAKELQQQVVDVLAQGGFQLRKWASNCDELLKGYPADHLEKPFRFEELGDNIFKVLGVEWNSRSDSFIYRVSDLMKCSTKRHVLSNIARIYDPCGFLAPVTFFAKVMMQRLWLFDISWDDPLPEEFLELWNSFADSFKLLQTPQISRFILSQSEYHCEIMGFSDASDKGYAAVVYLRVQDCSGVKVHLLCAKSRVAPLKQRLTIPRMELCGAVLLARLISRIISVLEPRVVIAATVAWCDSSIVLAWLQTPPFKLQTFEGNRVSQVQGLIPSASWRHVPSALNPADCASRGVIASDLVSHHLWWSPLWLKEDPSTWPTNITVTNENLPGLKLHSVVSMAVTSDLFPLIERFSSMSRLQRVIAWLLRFINNAQNPTDKIKGPLSVRELNIGLNTAVKLMQKEVFAEQTKALQANQFLKGPLSRLHIFVDASGLLRVGGRLKHSNLPYGSKHPILLPKSHHLTSLIIDQYHQTHLHVGPSALVNILRQRFWILSARQVVRHRVFQCHKCYRLRAKPVEPLMGNLPASRVRPGRPFIKVGIDFAGPFSVKSSTVRKSKISKAYLCVFICLSVKAVHLEVTSELTTEAFMASFHRFVSRRGRVSDVYSDCGKNFQGAKRQLAEVETFLKSNYEKLHINASSLGINWHMNPPYAPHMGGLWESTVKSAKQLLLRTVGYQVLTFEELSTVVSRAEAVLNSRPLCPISDDVTDLEVLTPGHFLIGQPLVSLPEHDFDPTPISPLKRWKLVQQISQHFWRRWHSEYLHHLQQRIKWCKGIPNLQLGDLVLIKEDNIPPLQWRKGRVSALHPGTDGVVRVVELQCSTGSCLRSVTKLCPLPKCDN